MQRPSNALALHGASALVIGTPLAPRYLQSSDMPVTTIEAHEQSWPLDKPFRISRGTRTEARVVVVTVTDGQAHRTW